jgi:hypothetical protein
MRSLAVVCVRALGAFLVATNVSVFASMLATQLSFDEFNRSIAVPMAPPAAAAVLGVAMIIWSKSLGALLASGLEEPAAPALGAQQLLRAGTALLGLFFIATAVSDIAAAAWDYFRQELSGRDAVAEMRRQRVVTFVVRAAASVAVGALLLWMARSVFARSAAAK